MKRMDQFMNYAGGSELELPGFVAGENITVLVKRPSLIGLAASGKIPNPLLGVAAKLFQSNLVETANDGKSFKDMAAVMNIIAKESLVEPSFKELEDAGVSLTDAQIVSLYTYAQTGVNTLKTFREIEKHSDLGQPGEGVSAPTE